MKQEEDQEGMCPEGVDLLLPWYLNHTLEEKEEEEVRKHVLSCSICQQELEAIEKEKELYQSLAEEVTVPQTFPQLMAQIERGNRRLWQRIISFVHLPQRRPAFATALIAVQAFMIVAFLYLLVINPWGAGERFYRTLSGPIVTEERGPKLVIRFREGVSENTMRQVILEVDGTIVSGPTAMGLYAVELRSDIDPEELRRVVSFLRQKIDVIRFVEVEGQ